jgi:hypothetical protein
MLPPKNLRASKLSEFGWDADFLSPVNWVVRDGKVTVPDYPKYMAELPKELQNDMRQRIEQVLGKYGYKAEFHDADKLVGTNGGLHCVSANMCLDLPAQ